MRRFCFQETLKKTIDVRSGVFEVKIKTIKLSETVKIKRGRGFGGKHLSIMDSRSRESPLSWNYRFSFDHEVINCRSELVTDSGGETWEAW